MKIKLGLIFGLIFGLLDVLLMVPLNIPDKAVAMWGAFVGRFAIGFLIPNTDLFVPSWLKGVIVGSLISLPEAIITKTYPILGIGIIGGLLIGVAVEKINMKGGEKYGRNCKRDCNHSK